MLIKRDFIYTPKGKNRPLHIWLPDDWETSGKRYSVMYFFDGHNLFLNEDATYGKSWGLKEFLDSWNREIILVGIECGHEGNERLSEYLPYRVWLNKFFRKFKPMGRETMDWIVGEIKPMIDKEYPTLPDWEHTAIGGSSMGGLMSLYAGVHYNRVFSKAACVSSAIGFCMGSLMKDIQESQIIPGTRFYLSWGTKEAQGNKNPDIADRHSKTYRWNTRAAAALKRKGASIALYCQVGGEHCEADWEKQNPIYMNYLWKE